MSASSRPPTVASRLAGRVVRHLRGLGLDVDALLATVSLDAATIADADARIDGVAYVRLWLAAVAATGRPALPFAVADADEESHDVVRFACMTSPDVRSALERLSRYMALTTNASTWPLVDEPDGARITVTRAFPLPVEASVIDVFAMAEIVALGRRLTGNTFRPREVRFAHPEPPHAAAYHQFFDAPVIFDQRNTELALDHATLALPLVMADRAMSSFFVARADALLETRAIDGSVVESVRRLLRDTLRGEAPSHREVAAKLGTSSRTLRRRLEAEGTSYAGVLDETRFAIARELLADGRLSLAEIAFFAGFSQTSALHRAFRRWTGMTMRAYARGER